MESLFLNEEVRPNLNVELEKPNEVKEVDEGELQKAEIKKIVRATILGMFKGEKYHHFKIQELQNHLVTTLINKLSVLKPRFPIEHSKYLVSCTIVQTGEGFHSSSSCYWDLELDQMITYHHHEPDFMVQVNVFAIAV